MTTPDSWDHCFITPSFPLLGDHQIRLLKHESQSLETEKLRNLTVCYHTLIFIV